MIYIYFKTEYSFVYRVYVNEILISEQLYIVYK